MNIIKQKRRDNAQVLLNDLEAKKRIPDERLKKVLGPDRWNQLQKDIDAIRMARMSRQPVPGYIKKAMQPYNKRLAVADNLERRAERSKAPTMPSNSTKQAMRFSGIYTGSYSSARQVCRYRAEAKYERAIEKLKEIIEEYPEIATYLDRYPVFDGENYNVSPDAAGVPRLKTSRSRYNQAPPATPASFRSLKAAALRSLIQNISYFQ